jgi:hypothetical protein
MGDRECGGNILGYRSMYKILFIYIYIYIDEWDIGGILK